jgi:transglutaminase-like putative cysteine protease
MTAPVRLTAVSAVAAGLGAVVLSPLIEGGNWLVRSLFVVVLVAVVGHAARTLRVPALLVPLAQLGALAGVLIALFAGEDAIFGVFPGEDAVRTLQITVEAGVATINEHAAPVPPTPGLLLIVMAGVGLIAVLMDLFVVGLRQPALAGLPLLALYSVPAATLSGGLPTLLFVFPAGGFLAVLLADGRERLNRWGRPLGAAWEPGTDRGDGRRPGGPVVEVSPAAITQLGRRIGVAVLGVAVVVPALVPLGDGLLAGGRFGTGGGGGGTIATLNPLVSLRRDLTRPQDVEVIRVRTDADSPRELYLRTVTLDVFDGQDWRSSSRRVERLDQALPPAAGLGTGVARVPVRSQVQVTDNLESDYLPLPYPAYRLEIDGNWRVDPATQNVVSHDGRRQITGRSYTVDSHILRPRLDQLQASQAADEDLDRYRQLPRVPDTVRELAREVVAGADTPFEKAVAIQDWLRDPRNFTYDLAVRPGTGTSAIIDFLTDRRGYCEQFASTMAIFARLADLPARVNVGFTSGDLRPDGSLSISAHDAHAWPEIYLSGVGWMRFEPTPAGGSATPTLPSWLDATAPGESPVPEETSATAPSDPSTSRPNPRDCSGGTRIEREECEALRREESGTGSGGRWPGRLPPVVIVLLAAAAGLGALPATVHAVVRRRRWVRTTDAVRHAEAAWAEVRDAATDLGHGWDEAETPRQASARLVHTAGLPRRGAQALARITRAVERARYSLDPDTAVDLRPDVRLVQAALAARVTRRTRLRARLAPRSSRLALHRAGDRTAAWLARLDRDVTLLARRLVGDPLRRLAGRADT